MAPEKAEQALYAEIEKLKSAGIDEHELQKAKNQAIANHYRSLRSINRRANVIGHYEVFFGDYHKLANVEQEYNKLTAADIQRAVKEYFDINNRTVATLVPDAAAGDARASPALNGGEARNETAPHNAGVLAYTRRCCSSHVDRLPWRNRRRLAPSLSIARVQARATAQRTYPAASRKARIAADQS